MFVRNAQLALLAVALATPALTAQIPAPAQPPAVPEPQDPVPAPVLTPAERIDQLKKRKQQLQEEIEFTRKHISTASEQLVKKLQRGEPEFSIIDAGKPPTLAAATPRAITERRYASVGTAEQMTTDGTVHMIVANGQPITEADYEAVLGYLQSFSSAGTDAMRSQRALFDMIRIAAIAGEFVEAVPNIGVEPTLAALAAGEMTFAEAIAKHGSVQGADPEGALVVTRNSHLGASFERVAFTTPEGETSEPFRTTRGIAVVHVDKIVKGDEPQGDTVECHVLEFPYSKDAGKLQQASFKVNSSQIDILVRDEDVLELLPQMFKKPAPPPSPQERMQRQLLMLDEQLTKLKAQDDPSLAERIQAIEAQIETIKERLATMGDEAAADSDNGDKQEPSDKKEPGDKKEQVVPVKGGGVKQEGGK